MEFLHSSLEALHTKRRERSQLAKEGPSNSLKLLGSFTYRKAETWDRYFYFPSEGRHAEDFYSRKNPTASAGFEPTNSGTRGQHSNHQTTEAVTAFTDFHMKLLHQPWHILLTLRQFMHCVHIPQTAEFQNQPRGAGESNELKAI
jgi:hypothetical protein